MRFFHLVTAAFIAVAALPAAAQRAPVPIVNHENVVVARAPGKPASADAVKKAIIAAGQTAARKWSVAEAAPGRLLATYQVRSHTVVTEIRYSANEFSVNYNDSVNMKYAPGPDGKGVIHPFYNQWVSEFIQAIRSELART